MIAARRARPGIAGVRPSIARFASATGGRELWRALAVLVMQPGRLTILYLHGVRARFASPLALYLLAGIALLVVLKFLTDGPRLHLDLLDFNIIVRPPAASCTRAVPATCGRIDQVAATVVRFWKGDARMERLVRRMLAVAPYVAVVALPVFAGIVACLHRHRPMRFGGHLVFAAHLHAFWFLVATLALLAPGGLGFAVALVAPAYALCSLHEVYGGPWRGTTLRACGIALGHLVLLLAAAAVVAAAWPVR